MEIPAKSILCKIVKIFSEIGLNKWKIVDEDKQKIAVERKIAIGYVFNQCPFLRNKYFVSFSNCFNFTNFERSFSAATFVYSLKFLVEL